MDKAITLKQTTADQHKYQAQADVNTLMSAHEIHSDPARHQRAKAHAKERMAALSNIHSSKAIVDTPSQPAPASMPATPTAGY